MGNLISVSVKWPEEIYNEIQRRAKAERRTFAAEAIFFIERGMEYIDACELEPGLKPAIIKILKSDIAQRRDELLSAIHNMNDLPDLEAETSDGSHSGPNSEDNLPVVGKYSRKKVQKKATSAENVKKVINEK